MDRVTRAHVWVSGVVQGVFFRAAAAEEARRLGLSGWVRNLSDGRVEAVFEGPEDRVRRAVGWAHRGPSHAVVERVDIEWEDPVGEAGFSTRG